MGQTNHKKNIFHILVIIGMAVIAITAFALSNAQVDIDDAYISYRYAHNLAQGHGLVYNIGERVYGATNVLWAVALGIASFVTQTPVDALANILNLTLLTLAVISTYVYLRTNHISLGHYILLILFILASPLYILVCSLGMETALYTFLLLLATAATVSEFWFLAGIFSGLAFMTRPDGLAIFITVIIVYLIIEWRDNRFKNLNKIYRKLLSTLGGFAMLVLPYLTLMYLYYGQFLPETLKAKQAQPFMSDRWWMPLHFINGPGVPVLVACIIGLYTFFKTDFNAGFTKPAFWSKTFIFSSVWLLIYSTAWTVVGIDLYPWYIGAMGPMCAILIVSVISMVEHQHKIKRYTVLVMLTSLTILCYWTLNAKDVTINNQRYIQDIEIPRMHIGETIRFATDSQDEIVGMGAIGLIGYYCGDCNVIDYGGLVTHHEQIPSLAQPTLRVGFQDEIPPDSTLLYMASYQNPLISIYVWTMDPSYTSWNAERIPRDKILNANFGETVRLEAINPVKLHAYPGETINFEVLWQFFEPLPENHTISYYIGNSNKPVLTFKDTDGFYNGMRTYQQIKPGEHILDWVSIEIPTKAKKGSYELAVMVYPTQGFEATGEVSTQFPYMYKIAQVIITPK